MGIYIHESALATIEGNTIYGPIQMPVARSGAILTLLAANGKANVRITTGAAPQLLRNTIHSGRHCGVYLRNGGGGLISHNLIRDNALYGVLIVSSSDALVGGNEVTRSGRAGVSVRREGQPIVEDNYIHANQVPA